MKRPFLFTRFLSAFLIALLLLPVPADGLRPQLDRSGLKEELRRAGMEERPRPTPQEIDLNKLANSLKHQGRWQEALGKLEEALQVRPNGSKNVVTLTAKADLLFRNHQVQVALETVAKAVTLIEGWGSPHPKDAATYVVYAKLLLAVRKSSEAVEAGRRAVEVDSRSVGGYIVLSQALLADEKSSEAETELRQALEVSPEDYRIHFQLGLLFVKTMDYSKAQLEFGETFRLNPSDAVAGEYALRDWAVVEEYEQKKALTQPTFLISSPLSVQPFVSSASPGSPLLRFQGKLVPLPGIGEPVWKGALQGDALCSEVFGVRQLRPGKVKAVALLVNFAEYVQGFQKAKRSRRYLKLVEGFFPQNVSSLEAILFYNAPPDVQRVIDSLKNRVHLFKGRPVVAFAGSPPLSDQPLVSIRLEREDRTVTVSFPSSSAGLEELLPRMKDSSDFIAVVQGEYGFTSAASFSPMIASKFANPCVLCVLDARSEGITAVAHADSLVRHLEDVQGIFDDFLSFGISKNQIKVDIYGVNAEGALTLADRLKGIFEQAEVLPEQIRIHLSGQRGDSRSIVVDARDGQGYELDEPGWSSSEGERQVRAIFQRSQNRDARLLRHADPRGLLPPSPLPGNEISSGMEESEKKKDLDEIGQWVLGLLLGRKFGSIGRRERWIRYKRRQSVMQSGTETAPAEPLSSVKPKEKPKLHQGLEPEEKLWFRLDPKKWPDLVKKSIDPLRRDGIAHIPLEGGEAVLLGRLSQDTNQYLLLDLLLKPDGASPVVAGRIDLFYENPRGYVVRGAPLFAVPFSQEALRTLEGMGVYKSKGSSPFQNLRANFKQKALYVSEEATEVSGISREVLQSAMTLVAVELLNTLGHPAWEVDQSYDNRFLAALTASSLPASPIPGNSILSAPLANVRTVLRNRLSNASAGLEEVDRLAREWVEEASRASSVRKNGRLKRQALEAVQAIADPKILRELLEDKIHTDRIWPGQIWWAPSLPELSFALAQLEYKRSGRLSLLIPKSDYPIPIPVESDVPPGGPLSLKTDLWVRESAAEGTGRLRLPVFLERLGIPSGALNTESFSVIVEGARGKLSLRRFPLVIRAVVDPADSTLGWVGTSWHESRGPMAKWMKKKGKIKVLSHVHTKRAILSVGDILNARQLKLAVPFLLMSSQGTQARLFVPKGFAGLKKAAAFIMEWEQRAKVKELPHFEELTEEGGLRLLQLDFLVVPVDLAALAQVQGIPLPQAGMEETKSVSEADLEEAKLRVRYALSLLTTDPMLLRWQVAGMSVVTQYPAVQFLDRYLLHFQIDPGDVGSKLLAESLRRQRPPADRLVYYGSIEEFSHFKTFSQRWGIFPGEKPIEPGTLAFEAFLKQLLSNLTGLPEEELLHRLQEINYPLSRLAADLELITRA